MADLTRQVEHEQKMRGFPEDRGRRLESGVHHKMSRAELISRAWALVPLVVGAALLVSLLVSTYYTHNLSWYYRATVPF